MFRMQKKNKKHFKKTQLRGQAEQTSKMRLAFDIIIKEMHSPNLLNYDHQKQSRIRRGMRSILVNPISSDYHAIIIHFRLNILNKFRLKDQLTQLF